jgi:hypothetical protein
MINTLVYAIKHPPETNIVYDVAAIESFNN